MSEGLIRFRAAAVFLDENRILVHEVPNSDDGRKWFIPPGGGIHYGETSREALVREIKEELGWEIRDPESLGAFESFHSINGRAEHEISFVYRIRGTPPAAFAGDEIHAVEEDGARKTFRWVSLAAIGEPGSLLYPPGLLNKLAS